MSFYASLSLHAVKLEIHSSFFKSAAEKLEKVGFLVSPLETSKQDDAKDEYGELFLSEKRKCEVAIRHNLEHPYR